MRAAAMLEPTLAPQRSAQPPADQAQGLRERFAGHGLAWLPLVANPHLADRGQALDPLVAVLVAQGRRVLVVDAAEGSPAPGDMAALDLGACVEPLGERVQYLAARGLPRQHVDLRGSAAGLLPLLAQAAPRADTVLLHAEAADLARLFGGAGVRALLLSADEPESLKHAYAAAKLLVQRGGHAAFDLLLAGARDAARRQRIADSLAACVDRFLGAVLHGHAGIDRTDDLALQGLVAAQMALAAGAAPTPFDTSACTAAAQNAKTPIQNRRA
jgi:flagellar biosynthesis protein FlhG